MREAINGIGLDARRESDPFSLLERPEGPPRLVACVPPLPDLSVTDFCRRQRGRESAGPDELPILVVGSPRRSARRLHDAGVTGQFDWPGERPAFIRAVLRIVGATGSRRFPTARDAALATKVEERLHAERKTFGTRLTVRVRRGVVVPRGKLDASWKIPALKRALSRILGVEKVVTSLLRAPDAAAAKGRIARSVRSILRIIDRP